MLCYVNLMYLCAQEYLFLHKSMVNFIFGIRISSLCPCPISTPESLLEQLLALPVLRSRIVTPLAGDWHQFHAET